MTLTSSSIVRHSAITPSHLSGAAVSIVRRTNGQSLIGRTRTRLVVGFFLRGDGFLKVNNATQEIRYEAATLDVISKTADKCGDRAYRNHVAPAGLRDSAQLPATWRRCHELDAHAKAPHAGESEAVRPLALPARRIRRCNSALGDFASAVLPSWLGTSRNRQLRWRAEKIRAADSRERPAHGADVSHGHREDTQEARDLPAPLVSPFLLGNRASRLSPYDCACRVSTRIPRRTMAIAPMAVIGRREHSTN